MAKYFGRIVTENAEFSGGLEFFQILSQNFLMVESKEFRQSKESPPEFKMRLYTARTKKKKNLFAITPN